MSSSDRILITLGAILYVVLVVELTFNLYFTWVIADILQRS